MKKFIFLFLIISSAAFAIDHQIMRLKKDGAIEFIGIDKLHPVQRDAIEKLLDFYEARESSKNGLKMFFRVEEDRPDRLEYCLGNEFKLKKG